MRQVALNKEDDSVKHILRQVGRWSGHPRQVARSSPRRLMMSYEKLWQVARSSPRKITMSYEKLCPVHHSFTVMSGRELRTSIGYAAAESSYGTIYSYQIPQGGYAPNGNILAHYDSIMGDWLFQYDAVDRLASAATGLNAPAGFQGQTAAWSYDSFGNRTAQSLSGNSTSSNWATYNSVDPEKADFRQMARRSGSR